MSFAQNFFHFFALSIITEFLVIVINILIYSGCPYSDLIIPVILLLKVLI